MNMEHGTWIMEHGCNYINICLMKVILIVLINTNFII